MHTYMSCLSSGETDKYSTFSICFDPVIYKFFFEYFMKVKIFDNLKFVLNLPKPSKRKSSECKVLVYITHVTQINNCNNFQYFNEMPILVSRPVQSYWAVCYATGIVIEPNRASGATNATPHINEHFIVESV